jgi:hypothetical protein
MAMGIITFDDLKRVLEAVGFRPAGIDGPRHVFKHVASGLSFTLPLTRRPARALPAYIAAVRGFLDHAGLLERSRFDAAILGLPAGPEKKRRARVAS